MDMPYLKEQRKKYKLNFNWKKLEELEQEQRTDQDEPEPMRPYYKIFSEWLRDNNLKQTEETEEIFRKCYSMYNSKKTIFDEIINRGHRLGVLQNKIDEAQTEINNLPVSPGVSGMQPRDPCRPWRGTLASGHKPR